jgi:NAD(P)-dependent dehydrogenase (short-subunit alcohol dehydrogenase family)
MSARLANKTALVTGATSNIGRAIATTFAAEGANVAVSGRSLSRGDEVVQEITRAGGHARFVAAHLNGSAIASRKLANEATEALGGGIDILVNSAGIFPGSTTPTVDEAMFDEVYAVNVKAPFFLTAAIAPEMSARGSGSIINLGSWVARLGIPVGRFTPPPKERWKPSPGRGLRSSDRRAYASTRSPPASYAPKSRTTQPRR